MNASDAMQFPVMAGAVLLFLYVLVTYFDKDLVNYCILLYIAVGSTTGVKYLLNMIFDLVGISMETYD